MHNIIAQTHYTLRTRFDVRPKTGETKPAPATADNTNARTIIKSLFTNCNNHVIVPVIKESKRHSNNYRSLDQYRFSGGCHETMCVRTMIFAIITLTYTIITTVWFSNVIFKCSFAPVRTSNRYRSTAPRRPVKKKKIETALAFELLFI